MINEQGVTTVQYCNTTQYNTIQSKGLYHCMDVSHSHSLTLSSITLSQLSLSLRLPSVEIGLFHLFVLPLEWKGTSVLTIEKYKCECE